MKLENLLMWEKKKKYLEEKIIKHETMISIDFTTIHCNTQKIETRKSINKYIQSLGIICLCLKT